ncbi:MAG: ABC transporter permease [Bdellovibrio sp.]|nr:MAG: ABC transporter permease [Bdellovibrio sp.]
MLVKIGYRNLLRNKRRTVNVLLTVAFGTASLFLFHGFNASVMDLYRENTIKSRWGNGQINTPGYRAQVFEKPWEHWIQNPEPVIKTLSAIPSVQYVFPRMEFFSLISNGKMNMAGRGQGVDGATEAKFFNNMNFVAGHNLEGEVDGIVVGRGLATAMNAKIGDRLTLLTNTVHSSINGADTTLTGIFHTGIKEFDDSFFRVPLKLAQTLLDVNSVESISLGLDSYQNWDKAAAEIKEKLPDYEATPFNVLDEIYYQHSVDWLKSQFTIFQTIIITVVILGIFNTVSTSILERKQEIGNLRANGESAGDVLAMLFWEGTFMGIAGGLLGLIIGLFIAQVLLANGITMPPAPGITRTFHFPIQLQPEMGMQTFVMGLMACIFATALAGFKVSRQPIADLLRAV